MVIKKFLKKYGLNYIPGIFFLVLCARITNLGPEALGKAIDLLGETHIDRAAVMHQAWVIVLIALAVFVTRFIWRMFIIMNARRMEVFLREELFVKLQNMPIGFFYKQRSGDLMAYAINDTNAVRMTFGPVLAQGINGIATAVLSIAAMARTIDGRLTVFAILPVVAAIVAIILIGDVVQKRFRRVQELFSRLSGFVNESIMGSRVIKSFSREKEWQQEFDTSSTQMRDANVALTDASAWLNPITTITFGLSYSISLIYGGQLVQQGTLGLGSLVAFLGYLLLIQQPVVSLGRIVNLIHRGLASYKRLNVIFEAEGIPAFEMQDYEGLLNGDIEARDLTFAYPGKDKPELDHVSFHIHPGETLGIAGVTGGGKTTLISLLLKFYETPRGQLLLNGVDINDIPAKAIREKVGYVPQDGFLFSTTIEENVRFYTPGVDLTAVQRAAALADIDADIQAFPKGYETEVGERGTRLSGGQKQRIALARALVRDPEVLILDDTLSAVDNVTEKTIVGNLETVLGEKTAIVISHRLSAIRHADQILYLEDGKVIEAGTHDELMALKGEYAEVFEKQSKEAAKDE
ncbi:MAG: ABC transporter ATP-binding protein [Lachnospiraceae bacterium]|nr:ABC transporter ATP-binding protein [Lachnospiraceae bacterium]